MREPNAGQVGFIPRRGLAIELIGTLLLWFGVAILAVAVLSPEKIGVTPILPRALAISVAVLFVIVGRRWQREGISVSTLDAADWAASCRKTDRDDLPGEGEAGVPVCSRSKEAGSTKFLSPSPDLETRLDER